jgi:zinc protease
MTRRAQLLAALGTVMLMTSLAAWAQDPPIAASPADIVYPPLEFEPPSPEESRTELPGGIPCFVVEDHSVPVATLGLSFRAGSFDDPAGKEGLASVAMQLLRMGGTQSMSPDELASELERLAIDVGASASSRTLTVSLSCLSEDLPRAVEILAEMIRSPRVDEGRLELLKAQTLEGLRHRLDSPNQVAQLYAEQILYRGHPAARIVTAESVAAITVDDIRDFLSSALDPDSLVVDMGGDVSRDRVAELLAPLLQGWEPTGFQPAAIPSDLDPLVPGVYVIDVASNQAVIIATQPGMSRHDPLYEPEFYALRVANMVLGGGFSSRLTQRIRVQEGLAYVVGAQGNSNVGYPGQQAMVALVDAQSAARACQIMAEELTAISTTPPSPEETRRAKQGLFGTWVGFFESPSSIARDYAALLLDEMPLDFYITWYEKTEQPEPEVVMEVVARRAPASEIRWVIAGPADMLTAEPGEGPSLADLGPVTVIRPGDPTGPVALPE